MRRSRLGSPTGILTAAALIFAGLYVGWLAVQAFAIEMNSGRAAQASAVLPGSSEIVLRQAMGDLIVNRGKVNKQALPGIRRATTQVPLDARPYLLIGSEYLQEGKTELAIRTLEAGRRLDPRQRWIHLLLLDYYLRHRKFSEASDEFAVLSRLVGSAQGPIATALAQMSLAPQTRDAARATLRRDVELQRSVLTSLAASGAAPADIFSMASPAALATANLPGAWGTVLVDRLVQQQRYEIARRVWQRINHLSDQQVATLLYDSGFRMLPGKSPFGWTIANNSVAAVDVRNGKLDITYYGRESGELLNQLVLLPPGNYRFSFQVAGVQQGTEPSLSWSILCENKPDRVLGRLAVPLKNNRPHVMAGVLQVPAGCPAQRLRLTGSAGEFPVTIAATIDGLRLEAIQAR